MTFFSYVTRPSGVGRTKWLPFIAIRIGCGLAIYYGITMIANQEPWGWLVLAFGPGLLIGFYLGTRSNYRTDKAREERGPNNFHYPDVCEGCDPVCRRSDDPAIDGSPLWDIHYYAATRNISREAAHAALLKMSGGDALLFSKEYERYVAHPKFDKFRS